MTVRKAEIFGDLGLPGWRAKLRGFTLKIPNPPRSKEGGVELSELMGGAQGEDLAIAALVALYERLPDLDSYFELIPELLTPVDDDPAQGSQREPRLAAILIARQSTADILRDLIEHGQKACVEKG